MSRTKKDKSIKKSKNVIVNHSLCLFCGACVGACPANAMFLWNAHLEINSQLCTFCCICAQICPVGALSATEERQEAIQ